METDLMANEKITDKSTDKASDRAKEWLDKVDQASIGDLRRKYPKAFWIVGGVVLLSLLL